MSCPCYLILTPNGGQEHPCPCHATAGQTECRSYGRRPPIRPWCARLACTRCPAPLRRTLRRSLGRRKEGLCIGGSSRLGTCAGILSSSILACGTYRIGCLVENRGRTRRQTRN